MQFGIYAPVPHVTVGSSEIARAVREGGGPLAPGAVDQQLALSKDVLLAAERAGFDIILFAERHLGTDLEAWMLAGAIAPLVSRIRSMVAVHPSLWSPQLIAKMATSLDRMTRGRMAINLVTGWNLDEHRMYGGGELVDNDDRYARAEEFVTVLRGMWSKTPFTFKGRFFDVEAAELLLKPATPTLPEIFTASRSTRGLDMVARVADWWFLDYDKEAETTSQVMASIRRSIDVMNERCAKTGRKVRYAFNPFIAFGPTREQAMAQTRRLLTPDEPDFDVRKLENRIAPAMRAGCVGTPQQVREQILAYHALGIELLLFKFPPTAARVEEIRAEVIAPLRDAKTATSSAAE